MIYEDDDEIVCPHCNQAPFDDDVSADELVIPGRIGFDSQDDHDCEKCGETLIAQRLGDNSIEILGG